MIGIQGCTRVSEGDGGRDCSPGLACPLTRFHNDGYQCNRAAGGFAGGSNRRRPPPARRTSPQVPCISEGESRSRQVSSRHEGCGPYQNAFFFDCNGRGRVFLAIAASKCPDATRHFSPLVPDQSAASAPQHTQRLAQKVVDAPVRLVFVRLRFIFAPSSTFTALALYLL